MNHDARVSSPCTNMNTEVSDVSRYFSGGTLYGDDLDADAIKRWFDQEEHGYYNLAKSYERYEYGYHALNQFHAYRFLSGRSFNRCLALGCARGDDVSPLASTVREFIAVEPAEQWWRSDICGTPSTYLKPSMLGEIGRASCRE